MLFADSPEDTLISHFCRRAAEDGPRTALWTKRDGKYRSLTWDEIATQARSYAAALVELGVRPGDRVILVSENRLEWIFCDLAVMLARATHVPVHSSLTGQQIAYQIVDSGARLAIFSTPEQLAKLDACPERLPADLKLVSFDPCPPRGGKEVERLGELAANAPASLGEQVQQRSLAELKPADLATILYTSGTTGEPKGVMLSHRNLVSNATAALAAFEFRPDELRLTWLPLSHIFARTCDLYGWVASGMQLALAESRDTILANCAEVRPTLLNGVPYFFDKVMRYLVDNGKANEPGALQGLLGGRIRYINSGGAALPNHVATFFQERGVLLVQGYGLTESSPVISANTETNHRLGTVGRAIPGVEMAIAPDGEVITRGPHVMQGYWNKPQATAETIRDGWLLTGDLGEIDSDGYLKITGRKKELIVTAAGKNIAPVLLESLLTEDPLIQQAMVIGDGRNYLVALIVPNRSLLEAEVPAAKTHSLNGDAARACVLRHAEARLKCVSTPEQVRKVHLLATPFSVESGELTPTLKLRRGEIGKKYAKEIEAMYDSQ